MCKAHLEGGAPSPPAYRAANLEGGAPSPPPVHGTHLEGGAPSPPPVHGTHLEGGAPSPPPVHGTHLEGGPPSLPPVHGTHLEGGAPSPPPVHGIHLEGGAPSPPPVHGIHVEGGAPSPMPVHGTHPPCRIRLLAALLPAAVLLASMAVAGQKAPAKARPKPRPADNSYCQVCHANLKSEPLAKTHQLAGVGCVRCHGESDKHSSDENNVTPPDIMYPPEKIAAACMKCHPASAWKKPKAKSVHAVYLAPKPSTNACTKCHGSHRLPVRTRRWDRTTGKLIRDDGVRMLPESKPGKQ